MDPRELRDIVAKNIRERARQQKMSLNRLADFAGIARSPFFRAMSGEASFTLDRLCKIANALQCPPHLLLEQPRGESKQD